MTILGEWFVALEGSEAPRRRELLLTEQGARLVETCHEFLDPDPARRRDLEEQLLTEANILDEFCAEQKRGNFDLPDEAFHLWYGKAEQLRRFAGCLMANSNR
jgi:type II secretory pathway predicted ATPase ExeA